MSRFDTQVQAGLERFNAGDFFAAHEAWEEAWKPSRGPRRALLAGLIQVAAALHQVGRGKRDGARRLLERAVERFALLPSELEGFDVDELESFARAAAQVLAEDGSPPDFTLVRASLADSMSKADEPCAATCPYCGEPVEVRVDPGGPANESYVEDCSVCCRPWRVEVERQPLDAPSVTLHRE